MNEIIKQLADQATVVEHGADNGFDRVVFDETLFAELIVRECASLAYDGPAGILEHFGITE